MTETHQHAKTRRVYSLDNQHLTEEQIAVVFAMTSRSPEPFDEIAQRVTEESAADFHEKWVLDYGHASVAEHAVLHLAVENISRLTCDTLENNRLASYTEKSSRYQVIGQDSFHVPAELDAHPGLRADYQDTCRRLFTVYQELIDRSTQYLRTVQAQRGEERTSAYNLRLRRQATDACRNVLPASTLTNVGMTANARTLEHAISKLLSANLQEERDLGLEIREQGRTTTPTLIKYAEASKHLENSHPEPPGPPMDEDEFQPSMDVTLVEWEMAAEEKLAAALLYRSMGMDYGTARRRASQAGPKEHRRIIEDALASMGPHDSPPREFETISYTFELLMDYGALREFRRHRMQTCIFQTLTVRHGVRTPELITLAGLEEPFLEATGSAERTFDRLAECNPSVAQYIVTHAHKQSVLSKMNLRECYHLFRLRTSERAHESIRAPMRQALDLVTQVHPDLFKHLTRQQ